MYRNLFTAALFVQWLTMLPVVLHGLPRWQVVLAAGLILLPQYLYLVCRGRYRRIAAGFDGWPQARRRRYGRWAWVYVLGSVGSWVLMLYVGKSFPNPLHLA